ncbi:MAG TPA: hypothetical protein VMR52_02575 [Dehalococcoidia bacterium]|nr:hypothetical protein [Dehalococcoidia bacterium]
MSAVLRTASVWIAAFVLAVFLGAFLAALTAYQLTSEGTGKRILQRSVVVTTEVDALLPAIEEDLEVRTSSGVPETVTVRNFPIAVQLTRDEARNLRGPALRDRIVTLAADKLYEDGGGAWASGDPAATPAVERFSAAGAINYGLGWIRDSTNLGLLVLAVFLALMTLTMAVMTMAIMPWDMRLLVAGGVSLLAGLPLLAGAVAVRFVFRTADAEGDPFVQRMLDIGVDAMWVAIRNALVMCLVGFALVLIASALLWWISRQSPHTGQSALDTYR